MGQATRTNCARTVIMVAIALVAAIGMIAASGGENHAMALNAKTYQGTYAQSKSAYKECGTYGTSSCYTVDVKKKSKNKIRIAINWLGRNWGPLYYASSKTLKIGKSKKVSFRYTDSFGNKGKAYVRLYKGRVKVKVVETSRASGYNPSTLSTGKYIVLKRVKKRNPDVGCDGIPSYA